jgi:hypothetical protein
MTEPSDPPVQTATQYLVWALEEIEKSGNQNAAEYARHAIDALRAGA